MEGVLAYGLLGAGIGLVVGVSPGPVLTLVMTETLNGGWLRGAAVAAGPLLADAPIIVLAVTVVRHLPPQFESVMSAIGGVFLLYLAVAAALHARRAEAPRARQSSARGGLLTGLLARALSPHPYLFWFLVGGPTLLQTQQVSSGWPVAAAYLVGYYLTIVGSNVGLALAVHHLVGLISQRVYRGVLFGASLIIAVYGVLLLGRAAESVSLESPP